MSRFSRFWRFVVDQSSATEPGTALALFRIGVGVSILWLLLPLLLTEVGKDVIAFSFCDVDYGGYRDLKATPAAKFLGGAKPEVITRLFWVAAGAGALMVLGLFGRLPVLVAAVTTKIALSQNFDVSGAGDALLGNALFLLLLGDVTATLSLDCKLRTGSFFDASPIPAWPRKLAVLQLCVVYTTTGVQKLVSTAWGPLDGFSALYQILQSPHWATFPQLIGEAGGVLRLPLSLLTLLTILWESAFFVVLWKVRLRPLFALVGLGIHAGIYVLMEVGIFSIISLAFYPVLFSPALVSALRQRWAKKKENEEPAPAAPIVAGAP